jgi:hypothetical protein
MGTNDTNFNDSLALLQTTLSEIFDGNAGAYFGLDFSDSPKVREEEIIYSEDSA